MRDSTSRRTARWAVGRDTRGYISRLQAAGRGHLSREHDHRRAHADAEEPADRQPRASASRPTGSSSCTGRTTNSRPTTWTPATSQTLGGASRGELRRHGVRPSRARGRRTASPATRSDGKAVIAQQRYDLWLLPLDGSAREEPDERRGHEERDAVPLRAHRAARRAAARARRAGAPGGRGGGAARQTIDLVEADHALGVRRVHEEGGFYELATDS